MHRAVGWLSGDRRTWFAALCGGAVVLGGLRGLPALPGSRFGVEWVLVPALLALATVPWWPLRWRVFSETARTAVGADRALMLLLAADALWTTVAVAWSPLPARGLAEAARSCATTASVFAFAAVMGDPDLRVRRAFAWPVLTAGIVLAGLAVGGSVASLGDWRTPWVASTLHSEVRGWSRASGPFGTPGTFGAMMLGFVGVASWARAARVVGPRVHLLAVTVAAASGVASGSIPGVACVAAAVWAAVAPRWRRLAAVAVGALLVLATAIIYLHVHSLSLGSWRYERPPEAGYAALGASGHPLRTLAAGPLSVQFHETGYLRIHAAHLRTLAAHPLGVGTGGFARVDTGPALRTDGRWSSHGHPHAWVLMRASEGGAVGALIAMALIGVAALRVLRLVRLLPREGALQLLAVVTGLFLWAAWFGDFLHRWDLAVLVAGLWRSPVQRAQGSASQQPPQTSAA